MSCILLKHEEINTVHILYLFVVLSIKLFSEMYNFLGWQTVVFCLVDIYIMLGKAFLPYLEGLNSTQLRLVTIYANRISQARTGTPIDANRS